MTHTYTHDTNPSRIIVGVKKYARLCKNIRSCFLFFGLKDSAATLLAQIFPYTYGHAVISYLVPVEVIISISDEVVVRAANYAAVIELENVGE